MQDRKLDPMVEATGYRKGIECMFHTEHVYKQPDKIEVDFAKYTEVPLREIDGVSVYTIAVTNLNRNKLGKKHRQIMREYFETFGRVVTCHVDCKTITAFITYADATIAYNVQDRGFRGELQLFNRTLRAFAANPKNQRLHAKNQHITIQQTLTSGPDTDEEQFCGLNCDALEMVMNFLPIHDKLHARRVCKLFKEASDASWGCYLLDLDPLKWFSHLSSTEAAKRQVTFPMLSSLLSIIGIRIKSLKLAPANFAKQLACRAIPSLLISCTNLSSLDLTGVILPRKGLQVIKEICSKLTELRLGPIAVTTYDELFDYEVRLILAKSLNIKTFSCTGLNISGSGLADINKDLEDFRLIFCNKLQLEEVVHVVKKLNKLRVFQLIKCRNNITPTVMAAISSAEITILDLRYTSFENQDSISTRFNDLHHCKNFAATEDNMLALSTELTPLIVKHTNIVELNVGGTLWMNDNLLNIISCELPKLQSLNIDGCLLVTDVGIRHLTHLQLKKLTINNIERISGTFLPSLLYLQELSAHDCPKITHNAISNLVQGVPELELLDIRNNCQVRISHIPFMRRGIVRSKTLSVIVNKVDGNYEHLLPTVKIIQRTMIYTNWSYLLPSTNILDFVNV